MKIIIVFRRRGDEAAGREIAITDEQIFNPGHYAAMQLTEKPPRGGEVELIGIYREE